MASPRANFWPSRVKEGESGILKTRSRNRRLDKGFSCAEHREKKEGTKGLSMWGS